MMTEGGTHRIAHAMDGSLTQDVYDLRSLHRMKSLCQMLRNNADKILAAETSITITNTTLYQLNEAIDNLQDGLSPPDLSLNLEDGRREGSADRLTELEHWNLHLQLVLDIVSKAPVLVLYKPKTRENPATDSSSSLSSPNGLQPLRLGYFTSLSHLEISCVPIQSIQDLLKMRERLRTLVVVSCVTANFKLQDVLEMCDGQVSVPMQWSVLTCLCLRRNHLKELDGSLRLCPRLEMLDLSRNCLITTDVYLGYLMELSHLDLSYNALKELPSVSATAKKKLRVLRLTGNKISSLAGIEEMTSLQELDVSENVILSHDSLLPLKGLHRLDELNIKGCPACMKRNHRLQTLHYISTVSLSRKFSLDGRPVTHKEIQNSRAVQQNTPYYPQTYQAPYHQQSLRHADITRPEERGPLRAGDVRVATPRKKKSRKKAKTRTMDIPDMDTGGSSRDVTPSTTPRAASRLETLAELRRQQVQETREEMEHLRRYYGESWLQAVEDKGILPRPQSTNTIATNAQTSQNPRKSRSGETVVRGERVTTTAELHVPSDSPHSTKHSESAANLGKCSRSSAEHKSAVLTMENPQALAGRVFDKENMFLSSSSGAEDGGANEVHDKVALSKVTSRQSEEGVYKASVLADDSFVREEGGGEERGEEEEGERTCVVYREQDSMIEPENQSEPFIVTLPGNHDDPFIVTVSQRYLVEKDINGVMQDMLDLQSVEVLRTAVGKTAHVATMETEVDDAEGHDIQEVKVILEFGYIRKDRRSRVYVMEDELTAQHFSELVQPFIDAKQQAALKKLQVQYQCLKCNSQFSKGEATAVVNSERIPHTGSIRDLSSMADIGGERVTLQCPKCQSDHIVQLETEHPHPSPSPLSASPSSLPSDGLPHLAFMRKQSVDQLTSHSPRAHSTPVKQKRHSFDVNSSRPLDRKASWSNALRSLFEKDSSDESTVKQATSQNEADSGDSFTLAADGGETTTTTLDDTATEAAFLSSIESRATTVAESVTSLVSSGESEGYDFKYLDHRLALYLMMTVFDNTEEFKFKVKTGVCQYLVFEEYEALVAVTNLKLYILRINTEDSSVELSEGLTLMEAQPHAELRRVDVGLGRQTLRLEYSSDCSSYTLIIRDIDKVDSLLELLSDQLQSYGMETGIPMSVVFHEDVDQQTLDTLAADVLDKGANSQQVLRLYSLGYIARGHNPQYPIAFVVSTSEVCLVRTNQQWPSPVHQAPVTVEIVGKQFTVLERQKINNIATVEIHDENRRWLRITFFNETSGDETRWLVSMETVRGAKELVEAVREPWEQEFGVDMDLEESLFDLDCHL